MSSARSPSIVAGPDPREPLPPVKSLTEWLRRSSDEQLARLLRRRPDLGLPAPADLATLASRLGVRTSVHRVVDRLDAFNLRVLEGLVLLAESSQPVALPDAADLLGRPVGDLLASVEELRELGLVWGEDNRLRLVATVSDAIGPYPAGLGRPARLLLGAVSDPAVGALLTNPDRLAELIATLPPAERAVLDQLADGPPLGEIRDPLTADEPIRTASPVHRLIARGLLVPIDARTVELPREAGLALRGPSPLGIAQLPPLVRTVGRTSAELDRLGTTAARDLLRLVAAVGRLWTRQPPAVLRSGGAGVRELRRAARAAEVAEPTAALLVEVMGAAGLLGATPGLEPVILPTTEFDTWHRRTRPQQWAELASAWLAMTRQPSLVGHRDERDRLITALGPDVERGTLPALRRQVLGMLGDLAPGQTPAARGELLARLGWQSPRRAIGQRPIVEAILDEADLLGVTAAGGLTSYGRAVLAGSSAAAEDALTIALPEPVDHFLVQPDLTVVVPGPPTAALAEELAASADLESSGGASVYRITEASVRRALDTGRSGTDLAAFFAQRSTTPVPQALSYLIEDVARRHGLLRTGAAAAYLRCDDDSLLRRVLADSHLAGLALRRIAPTVVISAAPVSRILDALRDAGYAPSAESPDGAVLRLDADQPRAPSRPLSRVAHSRSVLDSPRHIAELVRRVRSGDQLAEISRRVQPTGQRIPGVTTAATLGLLREAIRADQRVWLGYVDSHGTSSQHTIAPISMAGGTLRGHDEASGRLESFALHHITAVSVVEDDHRPPSADPATESR
ncbi:MAG: helicase-associated domain-containing protein [Actinomycetota bacterium]